MAQQNPSALSSLIFSPTTETRPAPPVACQTTKPLPCSLFAGPRGPLLLEPLSPTTAFRSPSRFCLAPATTPVAAVVPVLGLTFIQSFTLLVVLPTGLMLYVRVSRHGIVSAGITSDDFRGQNTEASPLSLSSRFSRFGTVSDWIHLQGLSPLSRLSFSSWALKATATFAAGSFVPNAEPYHRPGSACRQDGNSPRKPRLNEQ
jgi:hypothetical protein